MGMGMWLLDGVLDGVLYGVVDGWDALGYAR